jgi:hypothetical protein
MDAADCDVIGGESTVRQCIFQKSMYSWIRPESSHTLTKERSQGTIDNPYKYWI